MPDQRAPDWLLARAHGIAVIPNVVKVGLGIGGRGGKGVLVVRNAQGGWSNPSLHHAGRRQFWLAGGRADRGPAPGSHHRPEHRGNYGRQSHPGRRCFRRSWTCRTADLGRDRHQSLGGLFVLARERLVRRNRDRRVGHGDRQESECDLLRQAGHQDGRNLREYGATATRGASLHRDLGPRHSHGCERCRACCDATRDSGCSGCCARAGCCGSIASDTEPTSRTGHQDLPDGRSESRPGTAALTPEQTRPVVRAAKYPGPTSRYGRRFKPGAASTRRPPSPRP